MERTHSAAVYYFPDGFHTERQDLMGRHVAGASFLAGLARHHKVDPLVCFTSARQHAMDFHARVQKAAGRARPVRWVALDAMDKLADPGCVFLPGPGVGKHAWRRRFVDQRTYSLCGVTHTLCTMSTMDDIGDLLIAPVQSWDALICTSNDVKQVVAQVLEMWSSYLTERFGASPPVDIQLPIIPLAIDCDTLAASPRTLEMRQRFRREHAIADDDIALLFAGRLSITSKTHPLAMMQGAELAAARIGTKLHLVLAGWFDQPALEQEYRQVAARFAPSVNFIIVDGRSHPVYRPTWAAADIWTSADIFVSLSDNIQETFGLTPVEAMAAGLPVIVTDWDGYRDTVADGETGYRIPTLVPPPGSGVELAKRFASEQDSYGRYAGVAALSTIVDVGAYAEAIVRLAQDPALRKRLGAAGQARAKRHYDWSAVIPQYEALWGELAARRSAEPERVPRRDGQPGAPLRADPFAVFGCFATRTLGADWRLQGVTGGAEKALSLIMSTDLNTFGMDTLLPMATISELGARLAVEETSVLELLDSVPKEQQERAIRTVGWLLKMGLANVKEG